LYISVIIVNYCSKDFLIECLDSLKKQSLRFPFEVIVIDNGSFDGSGELVRQLFPWVNFIQNEENLGFARANNQAFRKSSGKNILFLNPDTVLGEDTLALLASHMERNPEAGAFGCRLVNAEGNLQHYCIQNFPTLLNEIFSSQWVKVKSLRKYHEGSQMGPLPVDCVSGACLMVRREVLDKTGGFSDEYFMYSEDVDLCRKIHNAGFQVLYAKNVSVVHHEGKSSCKMEKEVSNFTSMMMVESRFRYFSKHNGILYARTFRFLMLLSSIFRLLLLGLLVCIPISVRQGDIHGRIKKWRSVLEWSAGLRKVSI
jgi:GT2 family glycosyltransferase